MPTLLTQGAASARAYGFGASSAAANYIEDVFSTYLYTGNGSTQTITNGVDLSGKGGLVWIKRRDAPDNHRLVDTARGVNWALQSNTAGAQNNSFESVTAFNSDGFTVGAGSAVNFPSSAIVSWTFREQAKFFDVVTYTGDGANRTIAHNLGSVPGCIIVKQTSGVESWTVYHRSLTASGYGPAQGNYVELNSGNTINTSLPRWNNTSPTSAVFSVGTDASVNANGATYVAYLFAHNAGGFGLTGADNVITCGSFTGNASNPGPSVSLGYEPQLLIIKKVTGTGGFWSIWDNMRGLSVTEGKYLIANTTDTDQTSSPTAITPNSTGFQITNSGTTFNGSGDIYIYIAIRRGPMKTPTTGTSVFAPTTYTGAGTTQTVSSGLQTAGGSMVIIQDRFNSSASRVYDTLRGPLQEIYTQSTSAEVNRTSLDAGLKTFNMNGFTLGSYNYNGTNESGLSYVAWQLRRAPGFFDVVCYTGTASSTTRNHNLASVPELIISKPRGGTGDWVVYTAATGINQKMFLNDTAGATTTTAIWGASLPTSTTWTQLDTSIVSSGQTAISYLFGSIAGVSKVGSYTGTGTGNQNRINCGFTGGARFVLIKRTDSTGDWYVWDSARGIVAGNDPYLLLNSTAAEVTGTDYVDTYSLGFEISSTAPAAINANGGSFIFLAIA
jgi:hypothetical protein